MSLVVQLDSGPLGLVSNPRAVPLAMECERWVETLLVGGADVVVPEIADYEVRRELIRAGKREGIARLNVLRQALRYLPLSTKVMDQAAEYWAAARNLGRKAAPDAALDGDVILAAQAKSAAQPGGRYYQCPAPGSVCETPALERHPLESLNEALGRLHQPRQ